jgi:hypothetical protein
MAWCGTQIKVKYLNGAAQFVKVRGKGTGIMVSNLNGSLH